MAFEELLQLLARAEAVEAKQAEVMRLSMLATAEGLASGELAPADPELKQLAARLEAQALAEIGKASGSVEEFTRMAAEFAGKPGGEAVAEAYCRLAASATLLGARAEEYVTFMRRVGALTTAAAVAAAAGAGAPEATASTGTKRCRKPNARYLGPEWSN